MSAQCKELLIGMESKSISAPTTLRAAFSRMWLYVYSASFRKGFRNLKKHSGVAKAQVKLWTTGDKILMSLCDEGRGFDHKEISNNGGIGIRGIKEGVRLLGGRLEIHSEPRRGSRIEAYIPLQLVTDMLKG